MLFRELSHSELSFVVLLTDYICYEDCALRVNGNAQGSLLGAKDLAELSGLSYDTVRKLLYSLKNKELIGFHETGSGNTATKMITLNPYVFCRGIEVSDWVISFYSKTRWAKLEKEYTSWYSRKK